jgi:hypothetical protein
MPGGLVFWLGHQARTMKLDADEKELLESVESGEGKSLSGGKPERAPYSRMLNSPRAVKWPRGSRRPFARTAGLTERA